ncbi:uncharacterized protein LOC106096157 isoform X2 [Stomoxys calcitrans]|uniref:G-protein coupled receptors family 3 profile domain-containing protein n=1 Tax=Stomoxys calcitrans TaxID=35570 RepID=A0A1I8Q7S6_STOCA|nr:uncharacterized protein LOC106096157 isoform X2 [Stomoxys calcitrans]
MVRHERRSKAATATAPPRMSAADRTRKTRTIRQSAVYWIVLTLCVIEVHVARFALALDAEAFGNYDVVGVGGTAHEPRFGERLLPLRKKNVNANVISRTGGKVLGTSHTAPSVAESNVNNLLNRSNYVVSVESDARVRPKGDVLKNRETHSPEAFTLAVETLDDHAYETVTVSPRTRKAKQLNRREDINVADVANVILSNVSKADRLVEMSTEFFLVPTSSTTSPPNTSVPGKGGSKGRGLPNFIQPTLNPPVGPPRSVLIVAPKSTTNANNSATPPTIVSTHPTYTGLRKEPWVVPVLVLASLTMLMMAAFEIFVLFKAWRTSPSRRHLFLGQMLLLGLFACAGLGAIITAQPSLLTCGTIRFGVGVAYALVFAALLVKCVFLISLNGGVYLPAPYQGLLLLFAVLIQVAIGSQWLITSPPELFTLSVPFGGNNLLATPMSSQGGERSTAATFSSIFHGSTTGDVYARITATGTVLIPLCKTQFSEFLFSLIYIVFLIVFVAVLAIKSRGIRDNYREATYIGLTIGGAIPIWLGWMLCGLAVAERHKDACIAFGLIATSATVFLVMFMPKGRQLAAMGKEGLYVEDREEQFSSLSRGGSGYSPSFFHFKPIKYGVMSGGGGGFQNCASNSGNGANMKHSSNGLNAGAHLTTHPFCFYPQPPPPPPLAPPGITQLPAPPTLKHLGNSLSSMTQAHIAQTLRYPGLFIRPDDTNLYTTLEPTLSSNPNVYFQRGGAVHPGMMY